MKEFFVDYDEQLCNSLLEKFQALKNQVDTNIVPARLADYPRNWQCSYCQYKEVCKLVNGNELNWEEFKNKVKAEETQTS